MAGYHVVGQLSQYALLAKEKSSLDSQAGTCYAATFANKYQAWSQFCPAAKNVAGKLAKNVLTRTATAKQSTDATGSSASYASRMTK